MNISAYTSKIKGLRKAVAVGLPSLQNVNSNYRGHSDPVSAPVALNLLTFCDVRVCAVNSAMCLFHFYCFTLHFFFSFKISGFYFLICSCFLICQQGICFISLLFLCPFPPVFSIIFTYSLSLMLFKEMPYIKSDIGLSTSSEAHLSF